MNPWFLYFAGLAVFAVYFALFRRATLSLEAEQRRRLITEARLPWFHYALPPLLIVFLFVSSSLAVRVLLIGVLLASTSRGYVTHQNKLESLGFDPAYRRRLAIIFPLSPIAITLFGLATILFMTR